MSIVLLHLSDIHIKTVSDAVLRHAQEIAAAAFDAAREADLLLVIVSGDIAFSGEDSQYTAAEGFLNSIVQILRQEASCPVHVVTVPGNHDCDFTRSDGTREVLVNSLTGATPPPVDTSMIDSCTSVQESYFRFRDRIESPRRSDGDRLLWSSELEVSGRKIRVECVNVAWVSRKKERNGQLYFPVSRYSQASVDNVRVRVVIMHHPLNWFSSTIYRPFRQFVHRRADLLITGHEHEFNVGVRTDAESETTAYVEGCVLQNSADNLKDSSFNVVAMDLEQGQFKSTKYTWSGDRYSVLEQGAWTTYYALPVRQPNAFEITSGFAEVLDDPGPHLFPGARPNISLGDIYVFPTIRKINTTVDSSKELLDSERLIKLEEIRDGVLVEGDERSGRTALLYMLYRELHEQGHVPLYLRGKDLGGNIRHSLQVAIRKAVSRQYGEKKIEPFDQLPKERRVLLLDDFDEGVLNSGNLRAQLLEEIEKQFGASVITVGQMFEAREFLENSAKGKISGIKLYKLEPFGYRLRAKLIERWFTVVSGVTDDPEVRLKRDRAEKIVSTVMSRGIVPSVPLYLLTLLQSVEAGRSGDFRETALGYYYQYLLTEALQTVGTKPDKLTELFQYCTQLAWYFHVAQAEELSEQDLREFNTDFSRIWHTVDFSERLRLLVAAGIIRSREGQFSFRYPYIYYYLKGKYLSENLNDLATRAYIAHCCRHLYVRDHANTVLFLAHHSNDEFVLQTIVEALQGLFITQKALSLQGDTSGVEALIRDAPKLVHSGESPEQFRERHDRERDELGEVSDGLLEAEEKAQILSLPAQLLMLFKTIEILGQVLKNQYSKIKRPRKVELITELFNGPLRALADFFGYMSKNPAALVAAVDAELARRSYVQDEGKRKDIARKVVAGVTQFIACSFVMRAAEAVSSENLLEDIAAVVKSEKTLAFKLIELTVLLDSPRALPRKKLKEIYREARGDIVADRLLYLILLYRLYMFRTSEKDMQWLSDEMDINLGEQHKITYQQAERRLLE
jgi:hypothetical protein